MLDIITFIESFFTSESDSLSVTSLRFYKNKKKQRAGDYICYTSSCQRDSHLSFEMLQTKFLEMAPHIRQYIRMKESLHGISIFLDRNTCYSNIFREIFVLKEQYGHNNLFGGKVFHCTVDIEKKDNSLSCLRLKLVQEVLHGLLLATGGSFNDHDESNELICIHISRKNGMSNNQINLLVGSVVDGSSSRGIIDINEYERMRKEEIDSMSEHKLEINEVLDNKGDLIRTTMLFDLLQSNICRDVTLRLFVDNIDQKTSCKGSLFVMYNYVRLYSICETFNERVANGRYPPLPPIADVDFSLLSDDEWSLTFNFIMEWPAIIKKSIMDIYSGRPKIHVIFNFLTSLALQISRYYHRTRILVEPRQHLLPTLFARIHFIRSLIQIFMNSFKLLNITPAIRM